MCGIRCQERRPFGNRLWLLEQVLVILVPLASPTQYVTPPVGIVKPTSSSI